MSTAGIILVIEDDDELRSTLCELLDEEGYQVTAVPGGDEALRHLRASAVLPHLILLDLMMPGMNGWEFRREQLKDPRLSAIPAVLMTASRGQEDRTVSVTEIVLKPLQLDLLMKTVRRYCPS